MHSLALFVNLLDTDSTFYMNRKFYNLALWSCVSCQHVHKKLLAVPRHSPLLVFPSLPLVLFLLVTALFLFIEKKPFALYLLLLQFCFVYFWGMASDWSAGPTCCWDGYCFDHVLLLLPFVRELVVDVGSWWRHVTCLCWVLALGLAPDRPGPDRGRERW